MSIRSSNFGVDEDILLCRVYMEISQDPIVGVYQSADRLWSRVAVAFNKNKLEHWETRTPRSLQARVQNIEKATRKLHACIRAVESRHPSGASNEDIMKEAKTLFMQDPNYKRGWKYDHVWDITKNFEKFKDGSSRGKKSSIRYSSSESETPTPNSATQASPGISSFSIDLNDDRDNAFGGSSSHRPTGVKKAKLARKTKDDTSSYIQSMREDNHVFLSELKKNREQLDQHLEIQKINLALKKKKQEDKILYRDLTCVGDLNLRARLQDQQERIMRERAQQQHEPEHFATNAYNPYFGDVGGSGSDLPPY